VNKDITNNIKTVLEFYAALGIESVPLNLKTQEYTRHKVQDTGKISDVAYRVSTLNPEQKEDALKDLRSEIGDCQRCKLSKGRKNIVLGEGSLDAEIMFIGEAPGREEDIQAKPFVGDAGQLLTRLIEKMGFKREAVYIGNIVKCRPPSNRDPEEDEISSCIQFIKRQIEIISPKVIVSLGRISTQTLVASKIPISKVRGKFFSYEGIPLMPTFHPAYLLRNPKDKWLVWEDAQKVLEKLQK
jgi:uracil-DNA glycosylase family 4